MTKNNSEVKTENKNNADNVDVKLSQDLEKINLNTHKFVYQSSWGLTTRSIGIALMTHSDSVGAVIPPRVSQIQVVIIRCGKSSEEVDEYIKKIQSQLIDQNIRVKLDDRTNVTVGYKFNHWEIRGVPLRLEIGKKDMAENKLVAVKRNKLEKIVLENIDIGVKIRIMLDDMHEEMYNAAKNILDNSIKRVDSWDVFITEINDKNIALISWCGKISCEENIKEESCIRNDAKEVVTMGAKSLCIPFEYQENVKSCIKCGDAGKCIALFGRSY
ncbi:hypothetical protein EDEG_03207 [Edhazardia aedis USNM 41457]|uniref:proline--tRNA ligase n=1 Tax=Edhazardia aedis (strain USNM 41457) TaxID=1003232 RepID=J9DIB4_EDHAE|nr:hypothetical protein EDEG_03207 [Edhazardia aedis USNM 41457]|eukprot:EJW02365.1 hypothetical protein EDEG_03207 [Edhazardia aedis USNM 41457]